MKSDINRLLALRKPPMILTMGTGMRLNFLCNVLGLIFYACIRRANVFMSNYDLIPDEVSTGGTSNRKQRLLEKLMA